MLQNIPHKCPICQGETYVESIRCCECNTAITNKFAISKFDKLTAEQRDFVLAFIGVEGNFKEMEKALGVSYPTVKSRLAEIQQLLGVQSRNRDNTKEILEQIERGDGHCVDPQFDSKMSSFFSKFDNHAQNDNKNIKLLKKRLAQNEALLEEIEMQIEDLTKQKNQFKKSELVEDEFSYEIEIIEEKIEALEEKRDTIEDIIDNLSDQLDDLSSDDNTEQVHTVPKPPKLNFKKLGKDISQKVNSINLGNTVEQAMDEVDRAFSDLDNWFDNGLFSKKDQNASSGAETKNFEPTNKSFGDCTLYIKYRRSAFSFNGNFDISEASSISKNLRHVLSQEACTKVTNLVSEQFTGSYKWSHRNETLKVTIE